MRVRALPWCLAAVGFLAAALLAMAPVLSAPSVLLTGLDTFEDMRYRYLDRTDQKMVLATVMGNARRLIERPWALRDEGQCYPMPKAYALGEHMFGEGLVAAPVFALTRDPVLSYNALLVLRLWIPAMAMFALVLHVTRSPWAAFVAGLLYGLHNYRLTDPVHPYVHGDMWLPLALLFVHRLFEGAGWLVAVGLGVALSLSILESLYPLLASAILLTVFTLYLAVRFRSRLAHVVPRMGLALAMSAVTAWYVLSPYLGLRETWGILQGVQPLFGDVKEYLPRGEQFPGAMLLLLAAVGLADRVRGERATGAGDPRVALFVAAFVCFWCSVYYIPLWADEIKHTVRLPSPLRMLVGIVPGLDSVRAMVLVKIGMISGLAALAGYGVLALVEWLRPVARALVVAALAALVLLETLHPAVRPLMYGGMTPYNRAFVQNVETPVLDLPMGVGSLGNQAHYLHWAAYHGGATSGCYNSHLSPVQYATDEIASRLPDPAAARALAALGFASVVLHEELLRSHDREDVAASFARASSGLAEIARGGQHAVFRLEPAPSVDESFDALSTPQTAPAEEIEVSGPTASIPFVFTARSGATYRHPDPIAPSPLGVRWLSAAGAPHEGTFHGLLPLAIAGGDRSTRLLSVPADVGPGSYTVELFRQADPTRVLARARVRVAPSTADGAVSS